LDPDNRDAKKFLWTIGRMVQEDEQKSALVPGERREAVRMAWRSLEERRKNAEAVMARLKEAFGKGRARQSPQDLLSSAEGVGKYLGSRFEEERSRALAESYFQKVSEELSSALAGRRFVTGKDQETAEGWLAYYAGNWQAASAKWTAALKDDPKDAKLRAALDGLRRLIVRKENEKKILEWTEQAATLQETGYVAKAEDYWKKILAIDPGHETAARNLAVCRDAREKMEREKKLAALTEQGIELYQAGKFIDGAQKWLEALEIDPGYREARVWLSHVGDKIKRSAPPAQSLPKAATAAGARDPDKAYALYKDGLIAYADGQIATAIDCWEKSLRLDPDREQAKQALRQAKSEMRIKEVAGEK
jgi:tetratricopeptide (TPR) repeat protein